MHVGSTMAGVSVLLETGLAVSCVKRGDFDCEISEIAPECTSPPTITTCLPDSPIRRGHYRTVYNLTRLRQVLPLSYYFSDYISLLCLNKPPLLPILLVLNQNGPPCHPHGPQPTLDHCAPTWLSGLPLFEQSQEPQELRHVPRVRPAAVEVVPPEIVDDKLGPFLAEEGRRAAGGEDEVHRRGERPAWSAREGVWKGRQVRGELRAERRRASKRKGKREDGCVMQVFPCGALMRDA
eukprot:2989508-Rhodomonas_salina.1